MTSASAVQIATMVLMGLAVGLGAFYALQSSTTQRAPPPHALDSDFYGYNGRPANVPRLQDYDMVHQQPVVTHTEQQQQQLQQPAAPATQQKTLPPLPPFVRAEPGPRPSWVTPNSCQEAGALSRQLFTQPPTCTYTNAAYVHELFRHHGSATCSHPRACAESLYFFDDPDALWVQRVHRHQAAYALQLTYVDKCDDGYSGSFFATTWEPTWSCVLNFKIGDMIDGGKWVCDTPRIAALAKPLLIYSFGSNNLFDFEAGMLQFLPDSEIHTFDPTSYPPSDPALQHKVHFHHIGLAPTRTTASLGGACGSQCQVMPLADVIRDLGHEDKIIDIFKVDVEGAEFDTFIDTLWTCTFPINIRIILIEIHDLKFMGRSSVKTLPYDVQRLFMGFAHAGYVQYNKEPNAGSGGNCYEFSFIRLDLLHKD